MATSMKNKRSSESEDQNGAGDAKQPKLSEETKSKSDKHSSHLGWNTLNDFKLVTVMKDDSERKRICLHARTKLSSLSASSELQVDTMKDDSQADQDDQQISSKLPKFDGNDAIIVMEKIPFNSGTCQDLLSSKTSIEKTFSNDIYGTYIGYTDPKLNGLRTTIIYPATEKHYDKYLAHDKELIFETAADYKAITLPWIESESFNVQWIDNILTKKKESEFIIYEDPDPVNGFILLPDMKWDRKSMDSMYVSAIVHRYGIKSIRDLTTEHLPLLKNIRDAGINAITKEYGIPRTRVRAYFHYQPSYFHLHVHFNQIKFDAPGSSVLKAHLLSDVIENIELCPDFYQRRTLSFAIGVNEKLYGKFKECRESQEPKAVM